MPTRALTAAANERLLDLLARTFSEQGKTTYLGEQVSMAEHMLQSAATAEREGAEDALVAAALLHDIGHLVDEEGNPATYVRQHEASGAAFLARHFLPQVSEPVRLHVAAKRYLCAREAGYFAQLSNASIDTLNRQGGPMSEEEAVAFEFSPHAQSAIRVRRWDDAGKDASFAAPDFDHFRPLLERCLL